jgi:hypothetical protein
MKNILPLFLMTALVLLWVPNATANPLVITYDANLAPPGVYFGTGNFNGGFTIADENGIEIGLRAILRQGSSSIDAPDGTYLVPLGDEPGNPTGGPYAAWDVDFSINLNQGSGLDLAQVTTAITVKDLTTNVVLFSNAPVLPGGGDTYSPGDTQTYSGTETGVQNAENPLFFPGFNVETSNNYQITLAVYKGATLEDTDTIQVDVAPEPGTLLLLATGILGFGRLLRRKVQA